MKKFVAISIAAMLFSACDGNDSNKDAQPPAGEDAGGLDLAEAGTETDEDAKEIEKPSKPGQSKPDDAEETAVGTVAAGQVKAYAPTAGDLVVTDESFKQWQAGAEEPEYGPAAEASQEVTGLYRDNGKNCRYRVTAVRAGVEASYDVGCEQLQCDAASVLCATVDIDSSDVGSFKAADGERTTCVSVVNGMAVKTVTDSYTHGDVLREGRVVKTETYTCSAGAGKFDGEASLDWKVCEEGESFTKNLSVVTDQKAGDQEVYMPFAPDAAFKVAGAVAEPEKSVTNVSCTIMGDALTVSLTKSYCNKDNASQMLSFTLSQLPVTSQENFKSKAYGAMLFDQSVSASYLAAEEGACAVSYEVGDGFIGGKATCPGVMPLPADASQKVEISDVSFACGI